jgi:hypothetical protein
MRRIVVLLFALLSFAVNLPGQDVRLVETPIIGLPIGARVLAYAVVEAEDGSRLVAELETADGVAAFFVFVYAEGELVATAIGPRTIPAHFLEPPVHLPVTRRFEGEPRRYWPMAGLSPGDPIQFVSAPSLEAERFATHQTGEYPRTPRVGSSLTLSVHTLFPDGTLAESCVIEPNILAAEDRMTTAGARMIQPYDERLLLTGVAHTTAEGTGRIVPRLYTRAGELVAVSPRSVPYHVNRIPAVIQADLSGDGVAELIYIPTAVGAEMPLVVLRIERASSGRRILSFNLCAPRMNGDDVLALQMELAANGYDLGIHGIDGWYGPDTRAAVIAWQRNEREIVSGVVDLTRDDLR